MSKVVAATAMLAALFGIQYVAMTRAWGVEMQSWPYFAGCAVATVAVACHFVIAAIGEE